MNESASKNKYTLKPKMDSRHIFNMSLGFLGLQFCFALQTGNGSRILQTFGSNIEHLTWYWLAAPLTGMIIQPIIGHYSDNTWTALGRRRPYFLTGAILSSVALFFLPNSPGYSYFIPTVFFSAFMLMILDASFNVGMEPFRALIADNLPEEQHDLGFSVQTSIIGIGAILGSLSPYALANWFGITKTAEKGIVPDNVLYSFYVGVILLLTTVFWTVFTTKEYNPEEFARFESDQEKRKSKRNVIAEIFSNLKDMPETMKELILVQFFSWYAFFSMWVFMTPAIGEHVFHIVSGDTYSNEFNVAANWVNILFVVYNTVAAIYALLLPRILRTHNRKKTLFGGLVIGGLSLISTALIKDQYILLIPMIGIGIAWGSILAIPYSMLAACLPHNKVGVYMGIFNFTITIPQILNGIFGGLIVKYFFNDKGMYALVMAGCFLILAGIFTFTVKDVKEKLLE